MLPCAFYGAHSSQGMQIWTPSYNFHYLSSYFTTKLFPHFFPIILRKMCRQGQPVIRIAVSLPVENHANCDHIKPQVNTLLSPGTSNESSCSSGSFSQPFNSITGCFKNVNDSYRVLPRILGTGHYGSVRECVHRTSGKLYAIKSIEKKSFQSNDQLTQEVSLLRNINHRNIMKLVDVFEDLNYVYIISEKYNGGELFDKIIESTTDDHCMPEAEVVRITLSLLEAVSYLHSKNICHRDIKPENILFESNQRASEVRLIDFGLSCVHRSGQSPMTNPVGTAYYMSPEMISHGRSGYDRSVDLWAVGVVAYVMLCGYPPFNGRNDAEIFDSIRSGYYVFSPDKWCNISENAKDFIQCLLQPDPMWRPSAEEAMSHPWFLSFMCN